MILTFLDMNKCLYLTNCDFQNALSLILDSNIRMRWRKGETFCICLLLVFFESSQSQDVSSTPSEVEGKNSVNFKLLLV